ncbi:uncharacterized protein LOC104584316 isoform X1 [Brachypodium distachyon]|uniref:uncharacterized protein LOC104584316 isoform X1 n=1 Tax=Brachypodium distachyon TaxID=15368 RepID=UPI000D0D84EA|nr:uncharacterized protein LOC104584316 isoform X1 [Brachypodium distachyon]|eukprot:XP_024317855.1 uncharacterized protein LOC104584316 isoform X1 [Brachypodium distachyon]
MSIRPQGQTPVPYPDIDLSLAPPAAPSPSDEFRRVLAMVIRGRRPQRQPSPVLDLDLALAPPAAPFPSSPPQGQSFFFLQLLPLLQCASTQRPAGALPGASARRPAALPCSSRRELPWFRPRAPEPDELVAFVRTPRRHALERAVRRVCCTACTSSPPHPYPPTRACCRACTRSCRDAQIGGEIGEEQLKKRTSQGGRGGLREAIGGGGVARGALAE